MAAVVNCHFCNEIHFSNPRPYTEYDNDKIAFEYTDYSSNDIKKSEIERFIKIQRCITCGNDKFKYQLNNTIDGETEVIVF